MGGVASGVGKVVFTSVDNNNRASSNISACDNDHQEAADGRTPAVGLCVFGRILVILHCSVYFIMLFMNATMIALGFALLGYLLGSLPFSIWVTRLFIGVDVREAGSGHATATNTIRQAGWLAGAIVFVLDIAKGFLPTFLAAQYSELAWAVPLTAALAVAGHNWPIWAGFRGGMGLATTGGSLLAVFPIGFFAGVGLLIALVLGDQAWRAGLFCWGFLIRTVVMAFGGG